MIAIFPPSLSETMNWNVKLIVSLEYQGPMDYIFRNYAVYILDLTAGSSKVAQVRLELGRLSRRAPEMVQDGRD